MGRSVRGRWLGRRLFGLLLAGVAVEGTFVGLPWTQRVDLALFRDGVPLANQAFKLVDRRSEAACALSGLEGSTDPRGLFSGSREQWSTAFVIFDVQPRHDTLCILEAGAWRQVWDLPYGPAPKTLALSCEVAARPSVAKRRACRAGDGSRWWY